MKLSDFDYDLPPELIAKEPARPRDSSRLLVLDKTTGALEHKHFKDIIDYLEPGDCLVLNNSKVLPARLVGRSLGEGGADGKRIEILLSKNIAAASSWECLVKGRGLRPGLIIQFGESLTAELLNQASTLTEAKPVNYGLIRTNKTIDNVWLVRFNLIGQEFIKALEVVGQVPLPPYIKKSLTVKDKQDYQTVYADKTKLGSVAAPTAGLHFTKELLAKIKAKGVKVVCLTLHVGLGTFLPVKTDRIEEHQIHSEWAEIPQKTLQAILETKQSGKKVVAVGTTSVRTLEFFANFQFPISNFQTISKSQFPKLSAWINLFIYPGYQFKIVDALITNFHLPKSTLLMLVSAFSSKRLIDRAYASAIKAKYRFYSYGDAMFITQHITHNM